MRTVTPELAAAILAPERTVRVRLSVDWDGDGHGPPGSIDDLSDKADTVTVSSVLQGTLPEQVDVVEGTAAATLDVGLAKGDSDDERQNAVAYFSPMSSTSPLAGKERLARDVQLDVQFLTSKGFQAVPLLRGSTRSLPAQASTRTARLTGLDYRQRLRTLITLPAMAADVPRVGALAEVKPGLEATWVVSYVLSQCGFPLAPAPHTGCRLYVPMHGSAMPFVQRANFGSPVARTYDTTTNLATGPVQFGPGPFMLGTTRQASPLAVHVAPTFADGPALIGFDGHCSGQIELWVAPDGTEWQASTLTLSNPNPNTVVFTATGQLTLQLTNVNGTQTWNGPQVPHDGQWHLVGAQWSDAIGTVVFRIDGLSTTVVGAPNALVLGAVDAGWTANLQAVAPVAEVQVTALSAGLTWQPLTYTAPAVVDRSQNALDGIVPGAAQQAWQILQDLAAAEQGAAWLDADGRPHYATRARLVSTAAQVPQRTVDAVRDLFEAAYDLAVDRVANIVTAEYQAIAVTTQTQAWTVGQTIYVAPGKSVTLQASYSGLCTAQRSLTGHANTASDGSGTSYVIGSSAVTAVITYVSDTAAAIVVSNALKVAVWLVNSSGAADLAITGDEIAQSTGANPPVLTNETSRDTYGDQPLTLSSNSWIQTRSMAGGLAMATAGDLATPQPVWTDLRINGDPRLEYFDRVTASDPDNTGLQADLWYVGATHSIRPGGEYEQQLVARQARDRFTAGVGLVGVDLVG